MKQSRLLLAILTAATMLLILSVSIAVPILLRPFYYAHVFFLQLPARTGWTGQEICNAYNEMLNFCLFGTPFGTGVLRWSQTGMQHFADCARLFRLDFCILLLSALALLICHFVMRRGLLPTRPLGHGFGFWAGSLLAGLFAVVALLSALDFNRAFTIFHQLFFPGKTNWLFDPTTDQIILVLPQVYFRNCAILILALILSSCALLILRDRKNQI